MIKIKLVSLLRTKTPWLSKRVERHLSKNSKEIRLKRHNRSVALQIGLEIEKEQMNTMMK